MSIKQIAVMLMTVVAAAMLAGCADVPSTGPEVPDFKAEYRFVHAAGDLGSVEISVDGVAQGTVDFTGNLSYKEFPAGNREVALSSGENQPISMPTNQRGTIVVLPSIDGAAHELLRFNERRIFDAPPVGFRLINVNPQLTASLVVSAGADTVVNTTLGYKGVSGFHKVAAGSYALVVKNAEADTVMATSVLSVATSHTSLIMGNASTVVVTNLEDK